MVLPENIARIVNRGNAKSNSPVTFQDLHEVIDWINNLSSGGSGTLTAVSFSAPSYSSTDLIGKTPDINMLVFSAGGTGSMLNNGSAYTFDSATGTITVDPDSGSYRVIY